MNLHQLINQKLLKASFVGLVLICLSSSLALAKDAIVQVDLMAGYYSMNAKTKSASVSLANFGNYRVSVRRTLMPQVEFSVGYVLFTSELAGGDLGFGPDLGGFYYPLSNASPTVLNQSGVTANYGEHYRPFLSGSFHQRNFQSVNSNYAGFSMGGGTEIDMDRSWVLRTEFRYMVLSGPNSATAEFIDIHIGTSFSF